ncbi:uromodulin-like 1 [Polypterus senegalus]|uniref:uromodulin-like 1 n=1 Tax=Polypterus senegalus TaxID=55291 RepID=UPI0019645E78|nr:uromodulin-like 1 [Polypterus senegalus]
MRFDTIILGIEEYGSFSPTLQILSGNKPLLKNQTLTPDEEVLIDVSLNLGLPNARIVLNRCWATPSENLSDTTSYEFIKDSCLISNTHTTMIQNGKSSRAQVLMKVFSFVKENVVCLHCQIMLCIEDVGKSCQPNCGLRATRSSEGGTMKSKSSEPLYRAVHETGDPLSATESTVAFIILGVLLSVFLLAMISVFLCQCRKRIGHYNFNMKPGEKNFNFHAFAE